MRLSGRTILITGGSGGIGLGLAKKFVELDNEVIITGRNRTKLDAAVQGTPKLRARQLLRGWEPRRRGVYCGTVGLASPVAGCELNVAIRTVIPNSTETAVASMSLSALEPMVGPSIALGRWAALAAMVKRERA